ncbi:hypothetical protein A3A95_00575 [Candidatus Nomurabacteria bacterium RIFCSPLOWO2_01_FULL_39_18]|nr:MAG: hypothetical protein A3A95_00575 [Candidatus Nomurabacteria bacterium RIFCSPLOWO2_01_FULL_39_18]
MAIALFVNNSKILWTTQPNAQTVVLAVLTLAHARQKLILQKLQQLQLNRTKKNSPQKGLFFYDFKFILTDNSDKIFCKIVPNGL